MFRFCIPKTSLFQPGCIMELGNEIVRKGHKKVLIVTDVSLIKLGMVDKIIEILKASQIEHYIFDGVCQNPTTKNVYDALEKLRMENCDAIISIGGGSAHDCAKGTAILATNGGQPQDYLGTDMTKNKAMDLFAVNTTAGTASEITNTYVLTDLEKQVKMVFEDRNSIAEVAINDPELMVSLPKGLTATTGMDALTHAVECYVSNYSSTVTSALALSAIDIIATNLEKVVNNLENIKYREMMATGQYIAGMAFGNGGVGIVHSMAHQLGSVYNIQHGLCNAIIMPYVIEFNKKVCADKYAAIYKIVSGCSVGTDEELATKLVDWVHGLNKKLGITMTLEELGVKYKDLNMLAKKALEDVCTSTNPIQPSEKELVAIYKQAMEK